MSSATINGAIVGSVYFMLDGSPLGIAENNSAAIIPAMNIPEDGVEEVRVETQNTPASYQSGGAGVISLVSKSGTNKSTVMFSAYFGPISWQRMNTSTKKARRASASQTNPRTTIVIRRAPQSADPSSATSSFSSSIMRTRSRSSLTV